VKITDLTTPKLCYAPPFGSVFPLDSRTPFEVMQEKIEGFVNIQMSKYVCPFGYYSLLPGKQRKSVSFFF